MAYRARDVARARRAAEVGREDALRGHAFDRLHEPRRGLRLRLRARTVRVALHLHGLWAPAEGVDRRAVRRVRVSLDEPAIEALVYHFLRSALETLPTGRRPFLDELCFAYATLETALRLAAMRAARAGRETVAAEDLLAGMLLFRLLYYIVPFVISVILLTFREVILGSRFKREQQAAMADDKAAGLGMPRSGKYGDTGA